MPDPLPLQRPASPDALAAAVGAAAESHTQTKITGSDSLPLTRFDSGRPLQHLSTLRMNNILHHAPSDMTVAVHAGISLEALQRQLAWHDQWLPVDPPSIRSPGGRTIGGLIASNSLGPLRFGLAGGDWRRLILGMRWIDASGTLIKGGGQTVKNVAGYSSPRMMIGTAGTLGIIAEVTLRTFARPADERCAVFFCPDPQRAEALLAEILVSPTTPDYLQLVAGTTWKSNPLGLPAPDTTPSRDNRPLTLIAGFLGRPETCAAQLDIVRQLPAAQKIESISQTAAQAGRLRLWMTTESPIPATALGFRLHLPSSHAAATIAEIESRADGHAWLVSEAGNGVVRGIVWDEATSCVAGDFAEVHGANLVITQGTSSPRTPDPMAKRLKDALDPHGIFGIL